MPTTDTFPITASANDDLISRQGAAYPPTDAPTRAPSSTTVNAHRSKISTTYRLSNMLMKFDTSALPNTARVLSAVLRAYVSVRNSVDALNFSLDWYLFDGSDNDWTSTPGTNALAGIAIASLTLGADNDFTLLNATANVNTTGFTGLRGHVSQRASNAAPTDLNQVSIDSFDATTTPEPRLIVTWELGSVSRLMVGGVGI